MFHFGAPGPSGQHTFNVDPGSSAYFVGANGSGKTRLAVAFEGTFGQISHRIAAHRALNLNPSVPKISQADALKGLKYGVPNYNGQLAHRETNRWGGNQATSLLNDFDYLVQILFAEQANTSLVTHTNARLGSTVMPPMTKLEKLTEIWSNLFPHRRLLISGDDIRVSLGNETESYSASQMSDGERAAFYLIGQTLVAEESSLLIFDEPELHIHRSVLSRLWDEIEAARQDCGFIIISHDLDFVASRQGQKFVLKSYSPRIGWEIETVSEEVGFPEDIATLILGSRKPILFVEGSNKSLDLAVYRSCFPNWTIFPAGSCEQVIHSVSTMRSHKSLTRITCAGIVDADDYNEEEERILKSKGIDILSVSEIENLFALPDIIEQLLLDEGHRDNELKVKKLELTEAIVQFADADKNKAECILRYCRRRIDRTMKRIDLSNSQTPDEISCEFLRRTSELNVPELAKIAGDAINKAIVDRDIVSLLRWFDNKGLLAIVAQSKAQSKTIFEQWIIRTLNNKNKPDFSKALARYLPIPIAQ